MRKYYIAPELEIVCFTPAERLATGLTTDTDPLALLEGGFVDPVKPSEGDIDIDIGL